VEVKKFKGIYTDLSNNDYHGEKDHLSSSNLKTLLHDIEKFYQEKILGNKIQEQKAVFDEGNYCHSLILEPEQIDMEYAFFTGFRKTGKDWEIFKEANKDKIILSKPQKHRVESWVENYKKHETAVELLKDCRHEVSLFGEFNGVPVKVRADSINVEKGYIADIKTSAYDTDVDSFKLVVENREYDLSAALYCSMFELYYRKPFDFYFVVLGKNDGQCEVYKASKETIKVGSMKVVSALNIFKKCNKSGIWTKDKKSDILEKGDYEIKEV